MNVFEQYIINNHGQEGKKWLENMPNLVAQYEVKYGLSNLTPVNNLSINYVLTGWQQDLPIILKMSLDFSALKQEAEALEALKHANVPKLINYDDGLLLMTRIIPGITLKEYINSKSQKIKDSNKRIAISCQIIKSIQQKFIAKVHNFPHIEDQLRILDQNIASLPNSYLIKARELRDKLLKSAKDKQISQILLHGDLHYENIILHYENIILAVDDDNEQEKWLAIDPKGVIGYPINEVWATIINIEHDSQYIAEYFNFDLMEVREWYFVHLMLVACWVVEDKGNPQHFLKYAAEALKLISDK